MGLFLSMSGTIGKSENEVKNSLRKFVDKSSGKLKKSLSKEICLLHNKNNNTTILYPGHFTDYEASSKFISKDLKGLVFAFYIYDGDYWAYSLFQNGNLIDQFNPIPTYWDEDMSAEDMQELKGDAKLISQLIENVNEDHIKNYLVRWDSESLPDKAYANDECGYEEWQLVDFMNKIGFEYPIDDNGNSMGSIFKFE